VFDARLRLLGSVSLPPNWRLWQIGTERATATEINKFGVSQIHVLQVLSTMPTALYRFSKNETGGWT